uniref:Uncharacterized protein n=1 Tax=Anguilla anguilla TaxID=7936 RepID=A0A0E9UR54_ANGAN
MNSVFTQGRRTAGSHRAEQHHIPLPLCLIPTSP